MQRTLVSQILREPFHRWMISSCKTGNWLLFGFLAVSVPALAQTATTTTLTITNGGSAVTSVASGTVVTLTATVVSGSTPVTPGQVEFCDATVNYCTDIHLVALGQLTTTGTAVYKFRPGGGNHSYKAVFLGTKTYAKSSSGASSLDVTVPFVSTTSMSASPNGNSSTLTAQVSSGMSSPGSPSPTGTVSFVDTSNANTAFATQDVSEGTISTSLAYKSDSPLPSNLVSPNGSEIDSEVVADVNGDGIPDVIALASVAGSSAYSSYLVTYFGNGDGTFSSGVVTLVPGVQLGGLAVEGDFNGDGIPDVVVVDGISQAVVVMLGSSDGTFSLKSTLSGVSGGTVAVADFNHDGIPDIAITLSSSTAIWLGKGDGTFTEVSTTIPLTGSLYAADFNGDGIPDLLVGTTPEIYILLGNGDGTFTQKSSIPSSQFGGYLGEAYGTLATIVVADFTGDGVLDLAVFGGSGPSLYVLKGNGDGTFTSLSSLNSSAYDQYFVLGDFNADGIPDIATAEYNLGDSNFPINLYLGKGNGTFTAVSLTIPNLTTGSLTAADLNGDGVTDLLSSVGEQGGTWALLAQSGWTVTADLSYVSLSPGTHLITASYSGDTNFESSTSGAEAISMQTASVTTPSPGAVLVGGNTTFTWTTGRGVTQYKLDVGTGGEGSSDLYAGAPTTATSVAVSLGTVPFNGATITATLYSYMGGTWYPVSTTYSEPAFPALTSPTPGSQLPGSTATFTWSPGSGVSKYQFWVGTKWPGSFNIYGSGLTTATSTAVTGLPTDGVYVYVTLGYEINGVWTYLPYTYTAAGQPTPPVLTTPAPSSQLSGSTATFTWTPGSGVTQYQFWVGTKWPGSFNVYGSGLTTATSAAVTGLPTDGVYVYVTLGYEINGVWTYLPYTYTASGQPVPPVLTTPAPSSQLSGSTATFTWTPGSGVTQYQFWVGTKWPGSFNVYGSGLTTATSATVTGLPTDGVNVYVTLAYEINGVWTYVPYTYTAAGQTAPPALITPAPGSVLPGSTATFTWTPGSGVTSYQLSVGTYGVGYFNTYSSPSLPTTSQTVSVLPTNGKPVYVTLRYEIDGVAHALYYTYTAASPPPQPAILSPIPGSVLSGPGATFSWTLGNLNVYMVTFQVTDTNTDQLYQGTFFDMSDIGSATVADIPTNGETVYVYLSWLTVDGAGDGAISAAYTAANLPQSVKKQARTQ